MRKSDWERVLHNVNSVQENTMVQQQGIFRLIQALRAGRYDEAKAAIDYGIPVDMPLILGESWGGVPKSDAFRPLAMDNMKSITALGFFAAKGDIATMDWLLQQEATVSALFHGGMDAAWLAMEAEQHAAFTWLMERGAPVDLKSPLFEGATRLIRASSKTNLEAVSWLVKHKARLHAYDQKGWTALHHNFEHNPYTDNDASIGRLLIEWGGLPDAQTKEGLTVADLAHDEVQFALLRQHGLEKTWNTTPKIEVPAVVLDNEPTGPIIRPEPGDPGMPQLQKAPKSPRPRF